MKVVAFAASSSSTSINKALVTHAAQAFKATHAQEAEVEILDLNDFEMPIFSVDKEREGGVHELARAFFDKITSADALIISFAEHNGSYTAAYKNIFDWASRIDQKVFQGKPSVYLSTSPGGRGGASVLAAATNSAPFYGAELIGDLSIPRFHDAFDKESGALIAGEAAEQLGELLSKLAAAISA